MQQNCWSLRYSWSIACRRCSSYIFILDWTPGFNGWAKTAARRYDKHLSVWNWCAVSLQWCHNGRDSVSNHQPHDCSLNRLFRGRSKKTSKLRVTGLCAGNSPGTGEFPAQVASNAENISIWWRHHILEVGIQFTPAYRVWQTIKWYNNIIN